MKKRGELYPGSTQIDNGSLDAQVVRMGGSANGNAWRNFCCAYEAKTVVQTGILAWIVHELGAWRSFCCTLEAKTVVQAGMLAWIVHELGAWRSFCCTLEAKTVVQTGILAWIVHDSTPSEILSEPNKRTGWKARDGYQVGRQRRYGSGERREDRNDDHKI
ncbi:hypothetical protein RR46_04219 [Papilio xuthus]|uniref:Uncharacterized protein n=1 Tax=Papilio xuthus TaxID=66420 RepID=A0A194QDS0_PAPXU|nr:hypothetical protein RR46_04219 [Papilio xuthus]